MKKGFNISSGKYINAIISDEEKKEFRDFIKRMKNDSTTYSLRNSRFAQ